MGGIQWLLDLGVMALLAATLFHAVRLERALGVLKRDRGALEALVADFNGSTREAQAGIDRLRAAADGAGRQIARQTDAALGLKDDLVFLIERGERLADGLDQRVRAAAGQAAPRAPSRAFAASPALPPPAEPSQDGGWGEDARAALPPRIRSQAERDLLAALRVAR